MRVIANRRGATLTELMVAVVVMGIIGAGLTRLMSTQSRFFNDQEGQANARRVARAGINLLISDLRMAEGDSGVISATPSSMKLKVPFRMGVSCGTDIGLGRTYVTQQPIDSIIHADAGFDGWGYVDATGAPHYKAGGNRTIIPGATCKLLGVDTIPGGRTVYVTPAVVGATIGLPMFQYEEVTYFFKGSTAVPGTTGLFRTIGTGSGEEEIAAPFDSTAQFRYYIAGSGTPVSNPAVGTEIVGVDLQLIGLNERNVTAGKTQRAPFETAIYFKNR